MTDVLISRRDADSKIANFAGESLEISAMEERAFGGRSLPLGKIELKRLTSNSATPTDGSDGRQLALVRDGTFEWTLPSVEETTAKLKELMPKVNDSDVRRALDLAANSVVRLGLVNPVFDPAAIEEMPFRRSSTVVSDTSGVLQGGLDFVVRHIHKARVKIPHIVQMEVRNLSNTFLRIRRDAAKSGSNHKLAGKQLMSHLNSQGGERTLLRLEFQEDVEVERTYLLGDPLRSAFEQDREPALRGLNLSVPHKAYVDRLILEAARHHQAQSQPGHSVLLLTSDQGLARMTLAEGATPLYFRAVEAADVFGRQLVGRPLDPFTGEPKPISLATILWELATAFGSARLCGNRGTFTVSALGENLVWNPYHSKEDLLWCHVSITDPSGASSSPALHTDDDETVSSADASSKVAQSESRPVSYSRMNVNKLLTLICMLDDRQILTKSEVEDLLDLGTYSISHYRRFLLSASCLAIEQSHWRATQHLRAISAAARNEDSKSLFETLCQAPSIDALATRASALAKGERLDLSDLGYSIRTYRVLGEIMLLCASVGDEIYPTLSRPEPAEFAEIALARYQALADGQGLVPVGRWLEAMIQHEAIHPEVARRLLEQTSETGLLRRSTEGSTIQTQFDRHMVHVLRVDEGVPAAKQIHLYRGDYLIPGKASVSLRIERAKP